MAVIARRTWAQLLTEATKRCKGIDYSGFDSRLQYWLWQSYLWLSTVYGHFELDKIATGTLSTSDNQIDLATVASDCWIVMGIVIKSTSGANPPLAGLKQEDVHVLFASYRAIPAQPERFTRFGTKIYLNALPNAAYPYELFYKRFPTAPDFSGSATPDITVDCEEILLSAAVAAASSNLSMFDLAEIQNGLGSVWQSQSVRPLVNKGDLPNRPSRLLANQTHQGAQG